jgi:hypothetical protein
MRLKSKQKIQPSIVEIQCSERRLSWFSREFCIDPGIDPYVFWGKILWVLICPCI